MITPDALTGEMVKTIRTKHKITREAFKDRCVAAGLNWGKSVARLCNIEAKDSWKNGDREVVAQIINELEGNLSPTNAQLDAIEIGPLSNVDLKSEASGQSNVDSQGHEIDDAPRTKDSDDPFAASKKFIDGVRAEYGERHATADAMPPVPVWCDEDGSNPDDDDTSVTVEPVFVHGDGTPCHGCQICIGDAAEDYLLGVDPAVPGNITVAPVTRNGDGSFTINQAGWYEFSSGEGIQQIGEPETSGDVTFGSDATITMEIDDPDLELIDLLTDDVDENVFTITNSQVQTAKRCKRKWWLGWYRGLAPKNENLLDTRSTGTRVHRALQAWYVPDGTTPTDPRDALERVLVEDWTKIKTAAEERGHDEFVIGDLSTRFEKAASLERAMVEGYVQWLKETGADSQLKVIGAEQTVRAPLYDHVRADGEVMPVHAMGLLDVRAYRTSDGARLFLDHKTVGSLKDPVALLPMNEQMLHYHLIEWLSTSDGEERCDGALYNMLRRVKRTAAAKPPFYDRYEVRHNIHELETYRRRLIAETRDILHMVERLDAGADPMDVAYPTPSKNCTWDCDFFSICSMFDDGSHVEAAVESLYTTVDPNARYEPTKGNE